jgi:hypothetical protein
LLPTTKAAARSFGHGEREKVKVLRGSIVSSVALASVAVVTGCTSSAGTTNGGVGAGLLDEMPTVSASHQGTTLELTAWAACGRWVDGCLEGVPPEDPPDLGRVNGGPILVEVPSDGLTLDASFVDLSQHRTYACDTSSLSSELEQHGERVWEISPVGPADTYRVDVHASDGEGADFSVSFTTTTTTDHPWPKPVADLRSSFANEIFVRQTQPTRASFFLYLSHLGTTPTESRARILLLAGDEEYEISLRRFDDCEPPHYVSFRPDPSPPYPSADLGPPPYALRIEVDLDGIRHVATTKWPPDKPTYQGALQAILEFTPPLPAHDE